jgi:hypothetical protein
MKLEDIQAELGLTYFQNAIDNLGLAVKDEYTWDEVNQLRNFKRSSKKSNRKNNNQQKSEGQSTDSGEPGEAFSNAASRMGEQVDQAAAATGKVLAQRFQVGVGQHFVSSLQETDLSFFIGELANANEKGLAAVRENVDPQLSLTSLRSSNNLLNGTVEAEVATIE